MQLDYSIAPGFWAPSCVWNEKVWFPLGSCVFKGWMGTCSWAAQPRWPRAHRAWKSRRSADGLPSPPSSPDRTKGLFPETLWAVRTSPPALLHNWSSPFLDLPGVERNWPPILPSGMGSSSFLPTGPSGQSDGPGEHLGRHPQAVSCCLCEVPPGLKEKIKPAPGSTSGTIKSLIKLSTFRSPC